MNVHSADLLYRVSLVTAPRHRISPGLPRPTRLIRSPDARQADYRQDDADLVILPKGWGTPGRALGEHGDCPVLACEPPDG